MGRKHEFWKRGSKSGKAESKKPSPTSSPMRLSPGRKIENDEFHVDNRNRNHSRNADNVNDNNAGDDDDAAPSCNQHGTSRTVIDARKDKTTSKTTDGTTTKQIRTIICFLD